MVTSEMLAKLELFEGLPEETLRSIAAFCVQASFEPRETIFAMGQPADRTYLLLEGKVQLALHATALPKPATVTYLETTGQTFGWSAVIGSGYYTSAAQAVTPVRAIVFRGRELMQYLTQNPAVGFVVMQRVAQVMSQRLGAMRKLLLETIIDCDRPADASAEN
jgi:CRP/FNR family cyclic AMP-dependent transcriptional regulator